MEQDMKTGVLLSVYVKISRGTSVCSGFTMNQYLLLLSFILTISISSDILANQRKKYRVYYSNVSNQNAYKKKSISPHVVINITPPTKPIGGEIIVEVYNHSERPLSLVQFDFTLFNKGGFDINSPKIEVEDLLKARSAARKIQANIKGRFPHIDKARLGLLKIFDTNAKELFIDTYVQLVRTASGVRKPKTNAVKKK